MEDIVHTFDGHEILRGVSLEARRGELTCLLGPSGCGKTTLLRLAAGIEALQRGRVIINGDVVADAEDGLDRPPEQRSTGLMFQDYALFPHLTIGENIRFGLNGSAPDRLEWVARAMERTGMSRFVDAYPHTLSGGQQQRAALLRALAPAPRLLLLDEPFSNLDVSRRNQVRDTTLGLLKESGAATLMVTHDPEEAMFVSDRILVMEGGRIVQASTPADTYFHPANAFVAALFGPVNRLPGIVRNKKVETSLGTFDGFGLADGTSAQVLVRLEDMRMVEEDAGQAAATRVQVLSARLLGRSSHLRFAPIAEDAGGMVLQSRVPGVFLPAAGARMQVDIDRSKVFVFPA
ncbi:MAG: ABC transporter ATP-binding protein [Alphaproteobacteria bacterium]|nr:ABC transporter ATP-binding protein [Alphaproteobacteria bacterium]